MAPAPKPLTRLGRCSFELPEGSVRTGQVVKVGRNADDRVRNDVKNGLLFGSHA